MLIAIGATAFAAVALGFWAIAFGREDLIARRIRPGSYIDMTHDRRLQGGILGRLFLPGAVRAGRVLARLLPQNFYGYIERMLIMANSPMRPPVFLTVWLAAAIVAVLLPIQVARAGVIGSAGLMAILTVITVLYLGLAPYLLLMRRVRGRQKRIVRGLPYALDLLVTCVEAGLGVDAAFATVTERTRGPVSDAFALYLKEVGLGRSRRDALSHIAERTGVADLVRLAAAVAQAEEMGVTIGDVLRRQADELRTLRKQRAQEAAQKAPVWMTIPLVFCFLPALGAVIIVPSVLNLLRFLGNLRLTPPGA